MATWDFGQMGQVTTMRAEQVPRGITKIVKRAATVIQHEVVVHTPVDTGEARSNWVGTLDVPFDGTIPPYAPGKNLGLGERSNAAGAFAQASVAIKRFDVKRNLAIMLTNNVSHIALLNQGHSTGQQPEPGYINRAVMAGVVAVKGQRVLER